MKTELERAAQIEPSHESPVAQWLEHPTGVRKVIGSTHIGDSDFFLLSHARDKLK